MMRGEGGNAVMVSWLCGGSREAEIGYVEDAHLPICPFWSIRESQALT